MGWLLNNLSRPDPSGTTTSALLPLLQLAVRETALSQTFARQLAQLCMHRLNAPTQPPPSAITAATHRGLAQLATSLLTTVPGSFVAGTPLPMRLPPSMVPARAPGTRAVRRLGMAASAAAAAAAARSAALGRSVRARTLGYKEIDAALVLQEGLAMADARAAFERLQSAVARGIPAAAEMRAEFVRFACAWAAAAPLHNLWLAHSGGGEAKADSAPGDLDHPAKEVFIVGVLQAAAEAWVNARRFNPGDPVLQRPLRLWLDSMAGAHCGVSAREDRQAMQLLVSLVEAGLFCPAAYLQKLIADGTLRISNGVSAAPLRLVLLHRRVLRHLHPSLDMPTLRTLPPAVTAPGAAPSPPPDEAAVAAAAAVRKSRYENDRGATLHELNSGVFGSEAAGGDRENDFGSSQMEDELLCERRASGQLAGSSSVPAWAFGTPRKVGSGLGQQAQQQQRRRLRDAQKAVAQDMMGFEDGLELERAASGAEKAGKGPLQRDGSVLLTSEADAIPGGLLKCLQQLR